MIQEEKQELLVALCGYLPYGLKFKTFKYTDDGDKVITVNTAKAINYNTKQIQLDTNNWSEIDWWKPYLRPMSSMTEEEALELWDLLYSSYRRNKILEIIIKQECIDYILDDGVASTETFPIYYDNVVRTIDTFDWLNAHHFDFRNLIECGLALEAPKDMYIIKTE